MASASVAAVITRSGPNRSSASTASACDVHRPRRAVVRHHDLVEHRLQRGQDAVDVLVGHHRDHPDQETEVELVGQRVAKAAAPAGLCAASMKTVGALRIRSSRPGLCTGGETRPHGVDVELPVRAGAEERLHRGQRQHGVVGLVFTVQRQEDLGVHPAEPLQLQHLSADRDLPAQHRELRVLPGHRGVGA